MRRFTRSPVDACGSGMIRLWRRHGLRRRAGVSAWTHEIDRPEHARPCRSASTFHAQDEMVRPVVGHPTQPSCTVRTLVLARHYTEIARFHAPACRRSSTSLARLFPKKQVFMSRCHSSLREVGDRREYAGPFAGVSRVRHRRCRAEVGAPGKPLRHREGPYRLAIDRDKVLTSISPRAHAVSRTPSCASDPPRRRCAAGGVVS